MQMNSTEQSNAENYTDTNIKEGVKYGEQSY